MAQYDVHLRSSKDHPSQQVLIEHPAKRKVVKAGRRGGKTVGAANLAVLRFLEGRRIVYGAPSSDQLETFWFEVVRALRPLTDANIFRKDETEHVIEKPGTKQRIRAKTAHDANSWRGDFGDLLIFDEWQLMNEDAWEMVGAPMLMDNGGDAVFLYTPPRMQAPARSNVVSKARDPGHARAMFQYAQREMQNALRDGRPPFWLALTWTSKDNPYLSSEGFRNAARDMSVENYQREIMADETDFDSALFQEQWFRYYRFRASLPDKPLEDPLNYLLISHNRRERETIEDIDAGLIERKMIVDPNHAGKSGRAKHAIAVVGFLPEEAKKPQRFYLLDEWSEATGYGEFCEKIYTTAVKWAITDPYIETVAAQVYLKLYLEELNKLKPVALHFRELPKDTRAHAKDRRIEALEPFVRNGDFWMHESHAIAKRQLAMYYPGKDIDVDLIDAIGYAPQLFRLMRNADLTKILAEREQDYIRESSSMTGY